MNERQHTLALKRTHGESPELYLVRVAVTFELEGFPMLVDYANFTDKGVTVYAAIDAVLTDRKLIPYSAYLEAHAPGT